MKWNYDYFNHYYFFITWAGIILYLGWVSQSNPLYLSSPHLTTTNLFLDITASITCMKNYLILASSHFRVFFLVLILISWIFCPIFLSLYSYPWLPPLVLLSFFICAAYLWIYSNNTTIYLNYQYNFLSNVSSWLWTLVSWSRMMIENEDQLRIVDKVKLAPKITWHLVPHWSRRYSSTEYFMISEEIENSIWIAIDKISLNFWIESVGKLNFSNDDLFSNLWTKNESQAFFNNSSSD